MLHHVTLEVTPQGADRFAALLVEVGLVEVEPPASVGDGFRWFEREGTQIHLALTAEPVVPEQGHAALVAAERDLETVLGRLRELGYGISEGTPHWGERRAFVAAPDGHRIELMAAPPRRSTT